MISHFDFNSNNKNSVMAQDNSTHDYETEDAGNGNFVKTLRRFLRQQKQNSPLSEHLGHPVERTLVNRRKLLVL
jgi:hypothetical protein